jgi:aryl-alcohol dehydrogenase-like predicted oxidoreductase
MALPANILGRQLHVVRAVYRGVAAPWRNTATTASAACRAQATVGQVALAWLTGYYGDTVIPIAGASKPHDAEEAAGALMVRLSTDELERLAARSRHVDG